MKRIFALALVSLPLGAAGDYLGTLKPPQSGFTPNGVYSFASGPAFSIAPQLQPDSGYRVKLEGGGLSVPR